MAILGAELYRHELNYDYYFASVSLEADVGAWECVRGKVPEERILSADSFAGVVSCCEALLSSYRRVLIHCGGGWGQTRILAKLRCRYGKRVLLVGTTHSFQINTWKRIPMSAFQSVLYSLYYRMIVFQCRYAYEKFVGARCLSWLGKAKVIPLGCEKFPDGFAPSQSLDGISSSVRDVLHDRSVFKFVYLAELREGKNHVWLTRSLLPVLQSHPDVTVIFFGATDQTISDMVRRIAQDANVSKQVILAGRIPRQDIPAALSLCQCAIVPSRAETFGHNILEPMFAGLPVLGTRVGVGREIIRDGETGWTFSLHGPHSVRSGAEAMLKDRQRTRNMGLRARELVEASYTHDAVARALSSMYEELLYG